MICRSCGRPGTETILDLGRTPLANAFLTPEQLDDPEPTWPLDLALCPGCSLVQITETVPPDMLFRDYLYFSSFSDTMVRHARELVDGMIASLKLGAGSLAVEIASNDGYLLQHYQRRGIPVLGIEPARNIARIAQQERGIRTVCDFFGEPLAQQLLAEGVQADILHAHNVLAHVANLNGFVEGMRLMLKEGGRAVIEVPYCKDMFDRCEFDTIYHEHLCYFSLTALEHLFRRHGLVIEDVQRLEIHGGSLRVRCARADTATRSATSPSVEALLAEEAGWGVDRPEFYRGFALRIGTLRGQLRTLLADLKARGKRIAAYGAAAKGSTLLNYMGIGSDTVDFVVDRSSHKQGLHMPGVRLPIHSPARLLEAKPDYVLLLAWNFSEEILEQQAEYRRGGGRFIIPLPEPRIV